MIELCIHIANVFYLLSFLGRDMLWLRALTCAGLVLGIIFFTCQTTPLYGPTVWHVVFLVINGVQIVRLIEERRQLRLSVEQAQLGDAAFHDLSRDEMLTLLTHVTYENPARIQDIPRLCDQSLNADERVLRDLAFSRLSRNELMNLLTRRMWNSLRRRVPARRRKAEAETAEQGIPQAG